MPIAFRPATIVEHTVLASKYHLIVFETSESFAYKPGQYISVKVAETRINSYSIACSLGNNRYALLVDVSPGGPGSRFFENSKVGDPLSFLGPFGIFVYKPEDGAKQLVFLGTGSGCAPLRSLIDDMLLVKNVQTPITLYLGVRYITDIFWKDYFEDMQKKHPNFTFVLCLSKPDETWQGRSGHITDLVKQDFPDMKETAGYICGCKSMVEEAINILIECGCPKERIYSEKF